MANENEPGDNGGEARFRKVIDHAQLHQITEKLFARFPIHIVENSQKSPARALGYAHPHLEINHTLPPGTSRTLLLVRDDNSMMLDCSVISRSARGTEKLKPVRLFLGKRGVRQENRVSLSADELGGLVRHVIPHTEFYRVNAVTNAARDTLFAHYCAAVRSLMPETIVRIELQRTARLSVRMRKLQHFNLPVYAPEMKRQRTGEEQTIIAMPHAEYQQVMRSDGLPGDYFGEICEPVRYRDVLIVGYLQVFSTRAALTVPQYHSVRQLVRRLEQEMESRHCFPENPLAGKIMDVSRGGIGFVYPGQRTVMSNTAVGDKIVFDALFTAENKTTLSGKIMNATSLDAGRRYGIEFENLSDSADKALTAVLDKK